MPYSGMPDEKTGEAAAAEAEAEAEAAADELAAALQLDLHDDEFDDLALPDEEPHEAAAESSDALELDEHELEVLDAATEVEDEDEDEEPGPLYVEVDGRFTAVDKDRFVIGRVSNMCDLAIRDVNVSRQHCAIERRADGFYYAVDLGSINGIVIDGKRTNNHRIEEGDILVLSGHAIACSFHAPVITAAAPEPEPDYPNATGEFPPVPQAVIRHEPDAEAEPELEREPAPHVPAPMYAPAPRPAPMQPTSFEERIEQRLDYMMQQLAYLQQSLNALYVRVEQLQGVAALADMIQGRLATKRRDR